MSTRAQNASTISIADATSNSHGVPTYKPHTTHQTASSVWHEWFGTQYFDASTNCKCFPGGIHELEKVHKNRWRHHFTTSEAKLFSRIKLVVGHIQRLLERTGLTPSTLLTNVDAALMKRNISNHTNIEKFLKGDDFFHSTTLHENLYKI